MRDDNDRITTALLMTLSVAVAYLMVRDAMRGPLRLLPVMGGRNMVRVETSK